MLAIFKFFALASLHSVRPAIALTLAVLCLVAVLSWPSGFGRVGSQAWRIERCRSLFAALDLSDSLCRDAFKRRGGSMASIIGMIQHRQMPELPTLPSYYHTSMLFHIIITICHKSLSPVLYTTLLIFACPFFCFW